MVEDNVIEFKTQSSDGFDNLQQLDTENDRVLRCVDCKSTSFHLANSDLSNENHNDIDLIVCTKCGRAAWLGEPENA
jgi:uncharacterized protein with PIN domain